MQKQITGFTNKVYTFPLKIRQQRAHLTEYFDKMNWLPMIKS